MDWLLKGSSRRPGIGVILFVGFVIVIITGYLIGSGFFNYKIFMGGLLAVTILIIFFTGRAGISLGFTAWILLFALGLRYLYITTNLPIHALMILIMALFIPVIVSRTGIIRDKTYRMIPPLLGVFSLFWLWGWVPGLMGGGAWDVMLSEFLNFLILIPIFAVSAYMLKSEPDWRRATGTFFFAGVVIAFLGVAESRLSFLQSLMPGLNNNSGVYAILTGEGFARANFNIFGTSIAAIVCALSVPLVLPLWKWHRTVPLRIFLLLGLAVQLYGIYVSGTRAAWLMVFIALSLTLVFRTLRKNLVVAILIILLLAVGYRFLPTAAVSRATGVVATLRGQESESSILSRQYRAQYALKLIQEKPFGSGWGAAGWVASDFIQVAANLGVPAGLLFLGWYIYSLWRIWQLSRAFPDDLLVFGLLLCFICIGINLAIDGVEVITPFVAPVWFVWAMVEIRCRQSQLGNSLTAGGHHG